MLTAAHLHSLWEIRQQCDFMVVAIDPIIFSGYVASDGFQPDYLEKVANMRAVTFPDGRKVDLIVETHALDPTQDTKCVYLPYALEEGIYTMKMQDVNNILKIFKGATEYKLQQVWDSLPVSMVDRLKRVRYFVSEGDKYYRHKGFLAATRGIKVYPISYPAWKRRIHVSKLVERFGLGTPIT